ncbi:hypothetical protein AB6A40_010714 [Gnathostoma spinigerum]|uniref:Uncharacterized protein n=1 Tax=Gnathostoma spinigerum TaxID=75299 RepID=A0ABD6EVM6_9BILA
MVVRRSLGTTGGVQNSGPSHSLNAANFRELTASKRRKKFSESHLMASKKSSIAGEQQPRRAFSCAVDGLNVDASHNGPLNKGRRLSTAKTIDVPTSALWKDEADDE